MQNVFKTRIKLWNCEVSQCMFTDSNQSDWNSQAVHITLVPIAWGWVTPREIVFQTLTLLTSLPCCSRKDLTSVCQSGITQMTLVDNKLLLKKVYVPFFSTSVILCMWKKTHKHTFYIVKYQKCLILQKIGFSTGHSFISWRLAFNTAEDLLLGYELLEIAWENCLNAPPLLIASHIS